MDTNSSLISEEASAAADYLGLARMAVTAASEKLGHDPLIIDVGGVIGVTDYFVVTAGSTTRQVRAIVDEVEEQLTIGADLKPVNVEGSDYYEWVLMDYGGFMVHVLTDEQRAFYDLERLWADCPRPVPTA
ncbi:MAG: ribosome silencing factor [Acidimicrobiales bacterium]|nr:ribosome silencing factor [Actinomycetota bacterium]MDP6061842.1 ribosome silencing factor [Acidimicrobiales bacterium]MDP7209654.1 ribosome silencing factor [Acidimicrobiales bacterium]HJO99611.1 ribosome silencing factor [Acidimicrobiales bacterium]